MKVAIVGLGKMGISHLAILGAHPEVELAAACDGLSYLTQNLQKYSGIKTYNDFELMLDRENLDAVFVATPTKSHAPLVRKALESGLAVFCEKPFVLRADEGEELIQLAAAKNLTTQVGYHYRFVSTFEKAARLIASGMLGAVHHVRAEAYGPVVTKPQGMTWRSRSDEGGGALYDYACHAIDLVHFLVGPIRNVDGVIQRKIFSKNVDDEVYASLKIGDHTSGQLSVNWSDESYRKMTTKLTVWGENGSMTVDRQECLVYLSKEVENNQGCVKGWSAFNITELADPICFYLRGEEYSRQIDYFVESADLGREDGTNSFASAFETDRVVNLIQNYSGGSSDNMASGSATRSLWRRMTQRLEQESS